VQCRVDRESLAPFRVVGTLGRERGQEDLCAPCFRRKEIKKAYNARHAILPSK